MVVESEAEWDDRERTRLLALEVYEQGLCQCGFHESLTNDRSNHFTFDERKCPVCAGAARFMRVQAHADEQALKELGDKPAPGAPRPDDGRATFMRLMSEAEVADRRATRTPPGLDDRPPQPPRS